MALMCELFRCKPVSLLNQACKIAILVTGDVRPCSTLKTLKSTLAAYDAFLSVRTNAMRAMLKLWDVGDILTL
jgi:hypothetical protein